MNFVHLHGHSEFSLLDSACKVKDLVLKAKQKGFDSLALTDHGSMGGIFEFYKSCLTNQIKPILGCEVYMNVGNGGRFNKNAQKEKIHHLVVLAKNNIGFHNLIKLSSRAWVEGKYYKPRIDKELLEEYKEGLILLSACLKGEIPSLILSNNFQEAVARAEYFRKLTSNNFYLELQFNELEEQKKINRGLLDIATETKIPLVITNDYHYINKNDVELQDILLLIGTKKTMNDYDKSEENGDNKVFRFKARELYLQTERELLESHKKYHNYIDINIVQQAINNTNKIANECNATIDSKGYQFPKFQVPQEYEFLTWKENKLKNDSLEDAFFEWHCKLGFKKRIIGEIPNEKIGIYKKRMRYEVDIIKQMGFSTYFLVIEDIVKFSKQHSIIVGPGRGSVGGSLVAFVLGITDIDSVKFRLSFERFLVPGKVSMPDIDMDFADDSRDKVIDYIISKYGRKHVVSIGTYGRMNAKGVLRDLSRVFNGYKDIDVTNELTKKIEICSKSMYGKETLEEAKGRKKVIKEFSEYYPEVWNYAVQIEGQTRHVSKHAAGILVTPKPTIDYIPIHTRGNDILTAWAEGENKKEVSELGLLKIDILGLSMLSTIRRTLNYIEKGHSKKINLLDIPLNDKNIYKEFSLGLTEGIFQFETMQMKKLLYLVKPEKFRHLTAVNALVRPVTLTEKINLGELIGDVSVAVAYAFKKNGNTTEEHIHPLLAPILKDTYGIMCYQEQAMEIARQLAGYNWTEVDVLRKILLKVKKGKVLEEEGEKFVSCCVKNNIKKEDAEGIWKYIKAFGTYGFNKSHSTAYALLGYWGMWLKYYYPLEYIGSLLQASEKDEKNHERYSEEAQRLGIDILNVDINKSKKHFIIEGNALRKPFMTIKNVGPNAIEHIIQYQPYKDYFDFIGKTSRRQVNKRVMENLNNEGCFVQFGMGSNKNQAKNQDRERIIKEYNKSRKNTQDCLPLSKILTQTHTTEFVTFAKICKIDLVTNYGVYYFITIQDFDFTKYTIGCSQELFEEKKLSDKTGRWFKIFLSNNLKNNLKLKNAILV